MNLPYMLRLLCISLSSLFLVHTALAMALNLAAPYAIRFAGKRQAKQAASLLFGLRLLPIALACVIVLGLCVPSYLWLEPNRANEAVGLTCLALGLLGAAISAWSLGRVGKVLAGSVRFSGAYERKGRETSFSGESSPIWVIPQTSPLLAVSGIFRQKIYVSASVLQSLSLDELSVALLHERAHRVWRDNLKRLFLVLAPRTIPMSRGLRQIDRAWSKFTEWAADDLAVAGDSHRALSLAAALVRVARLGSPAPRPVFLSSLADVCDLSERVERLLHPMPRPASPLNARSSLIIASALALAASVAAWFLWPASLHAAHEILERLIS